jgi:hypothetical protein
MPEERLKDGDGMVHGMVKNMRLSEIFDQLPETWKREWMRQPAYRQAVEAGMTLPDAMADRRAARSLYEDMSARERAVLAHIVVEKGPAEFAERELAPAGLGAAETRVGLLGLRRKGVVLAMRKMWGERAYRVPRDTYPVWREIVMPDLPSDGSPFVCAHDADPAFDGEPLHEAGDGMAEDVFRLLVFIRKVGLPLSGNGMIPKRSLMQLDSRLTIDAAAAGEARTLRCVPAGCPPRAAHVLQTALKLGLIRLDPDGVRLAEERVREWVARSRLALAARFMDLWENERPKAPIWTVHVADYIASLPPGKWYRLAPIVEAVCARLPCQPFETLPQRVQTAVSDCLLPLAAMGLLRAERTPSGDVRFQPADLGDEMHECYVQDDFEIIVPPAASFGLRWRLESFADEDGQGGTVRYRITKDSVRRACEAGMTARDICAALESCAVGGVPTHVTDTIHHWAGQLGRVTVEEARLLRCRDAQIAEQIAAHPALSPWIVQRLTERDFLIRRDRGRELARILEQSGLPPIWLAPEEEETRPSAPEKNAALRGDRAAASRAEAPLRPSPPRETGRRHAAHRTAGAASGEYGASGLAGQGADAAPGIVWDAAIPDVRELYPDLDKVPAIWLSRPRSYHDSTRKDMIRKAIEWQARLKVRAAGKEISIAPVRLVEGENGCTVVIRGGADQERMALSEWEEMQLILPGINDTNEDRLRKDEQEVQS